MVGRRTQTGVRSNNLISLVGFVFVRKTKTVLPCSSLWFYANFNIDAQGAVDILNKSLWNMKLQNSII